MMVLKIDEDNCLRSGLKIPEGFRLLEDYELLELVHKNPEIKKLVINGWVWCHSKHFKRAVVLGVIRFGIYVSIDDGRPARGVFAKKQSQK